MKLYVSDITLFCNGYFGKIHIYPNYYVLSMKARWIVYLYYNNLLNMDKFEDNIFMIHINELIENGYLEKIHG